MCFVAPNAYPLLAGDETFQLIGGAELQQVIIARKLAARGLRVSMICLNFGQADEIEIDGIKVFRAYKRDAGVPIIRFVWPRLTSIWKCMKRVDADIYYQRTAGMLTGVVAAFCKMHGKRSVFAAAGNPDLSAKHPKNSTCEGSSGSIPMACGTLIVSLSRMMSRRGFAGCISDVSRSRYQIAIQRRLGVWASMATVAFYGCQPSGVSSGRNFI